MRTAGYADVVLFPLELSPIDASRPMRLKLSADLGVCKEICVLEAVSEVLDIAPGDAEIGARQVRSALRRVPQPAPVEMVRLDVCDIAGRGRERDMTISLSLAEDLRDSVVLLENEQGIWIRHLVQERTDAGVRLDVEVRLPRDLSWIDRSAFRMTVLSDLAAYDLRGCTAE